MIAKRPFSISELVLDISSLVRDIFRYNVKIASIISIPIADATISSIRLIPS
ncbi:hypothetical protein D3C78_1040320 [compost metagenome]